MKWTCILVDMCSVQSNPVSSWRFTRVRRDVDYLSVHHSRWCPLAAITAAVRRALARELAIGVRQPEPKATAASAHFPWLSEIATISRSSRAEKENTDR